jgi:hypothetical protein
MTRQFGVCGIGWKFCYSEPVFKEADGRIAVFVDCELYIKVGDTWSAPIQQSGGAMFCEKEKVGYYVDDDAIKKAQTDAFGKCCQYLGVAADVYWEQGSTKYDMRTGGEAEKPTPAAKPPAPQTPPASEPSNKQILHDFCFKNGIDLQYAAQKLKSYGVNFASELSPSRLGMLLRELESEKKSA